MIRPRSWRATVFQTTTFVALLTTFLLLPATVKRANAQGGPERDGAAITAMQNSVAAMGGPNQWAAILDWSIGGQVTTSGSGQQANFSWIGSGVEFHNET